MERERQMERKRDVDRVRKNKAMGENRLILAARRQSPDIETCHYVPIKHRSS